MRNFFQKYMMFMQGRYGSDSLNKFLGIVSVVLWLLNIIAGFFTWMLPWQARLTIRLVFSLLFFVTVGFLIFRFLSRNINKRIAENRKFVSLYNPAKQWFKLNIRKFKERKEYKYVKCPDCKAQLRVKNIKGRHTICCPKCKKEFTKKI